MAAQAGLCWTWSETQKTGFFASRLNYAPNTTRDLFKMRSVMRVFFFFFFFFFLLRRKQRCSLAVQQLCSNDQRLCFHCTNSTIFLPLRSEISYFQPFSVTVQAGLYWNRMETPKTSFLVSWLQLHRKL